MVRLSIAYPVAAPYGAARRRHSQQHRRGEDVEIPLRRIGMGTVMSESAAPSLPLGRYGVPISAIKNVRTGAHGSLPAPKGPDDLLRI